MKKIFSIALVLAAVALPAMLTSCSNDDDIPNVSFNLAVAGGELDQNTGTIYIVQGDTLNIESLSVTNLDSDKAAAVTDAQYFWDYNFLGGTPIAPYKFTIVTNDNTPLGDHVLSIKANVVAVDKAPAVAVVDYPVVVVADSTQLPTTNLTTSMTSKALVQK